jgi:hypothetical protein
MDGGRLAGMEAREPRAKTGDFVCRGSDLDRG